MACKMERDIKRMEFYRRMVFTAAPTEQRVCVQWDPVIFGRGFMRKQDCFNRICAYDGGKGKQTKPGGMIYVKKENPHGGGFELLQFVRTAQKSVLTRIIFYFQTEWRSVSGATPVFN